MFMALILPNKSGRTFNFSPSALKIREEKIVMKTLKQLLFAIAIIIGISMTTSAQKEGEKKPPPPKPSPPVIVVPPRKNPPKEDKPKNDDKRKKPEAFILNFRYE